MPSDLLAEVALRAALPGGDSVLTYSVPTRLRALARPGQFVWAPLRRQQVQGVILDLFLRDQDGSGAWALREPDARRPFAGDLRDLIDVVDPDVALTLPQLRLARRVSEYYCTPLYDVLTLMLPPGTAQDAETTWRATDAGLAVELGTLPVRERAVLYYLRQEGETGERDLRQALRGSDTDLRQAYAALQERGLLARGIFMNRPRVRPRTERMARILAPFADLERMLDDLRRAPRQRRVIEFLRDYGFAATDETGSTAVRAIPLPAPEIADQTGADLGVLRALERRGVLELSTREVRRDPLSGDSVMPDVPPPLTPAQERSWRAIADTLDANAATPGSAATTFLLHGVTGSGKTEIYLRAIGRVLRQGRQALMLVPEIALTVQLVRRFAARFPGKLAVLHSGLSLGERYDEWRRLRRGEARVAIGSRSAVFAPLPEPGLIILDEEHEPSFKHDSAPRYHARDVAQHLAELTGSVLILGSATPSLETYTAARAGQMRLLELPERVGMRRDANGMPHSQALPLPPVQIVDMRDELRDGNRSIFSRPLQQALADALERGEQAILFLNRRGLANFVMCRECGHVISCPNCSSPLTLHLNEKPPPAARDEPPHPTHADADLEHAESVLVCHGCNHRELEPIICPNCWSPRIKSFGVGTQRVAEEAALLFPNARVIRWDRDSVTRKGDHERLLEQFLRHEADLLVGTQMIAKGLDLPLVSVVGVIAADTGLHLPDFRAGERTFQLLAQVAGRAGRRSANARVVVQTYGPDHYALRAAQEHDYALFYRQEIAFRRATGYPPFGRLVRLVYSSGSDERAARAAHDMAEHLRRLVAPLNLDDWRLIGPAPAFFHQQRNRYRWHLLICARDPTPLLRVLHLPPGWSFDRDPVHVL